MDRLEKSNMDNEGFIKTVFPFDEAQKDPENAEKQEALDKAKRKASGYYDTKYFMDNKENLKKIKEEIDKTGFSGLVDEEGEFTFVPNTRN